MGEAMTPTWVSECGSVQLYLGDCLQVLPTLEAGSVDAVVTSPPYNTLPTRNAPSGLHAERKSGVNQWISRAVDSYEDARPESEYQSWLRDVVAACLVVAPLVWVNHKVRYRDGKAVHPVRFLPFPIYSEIIWDRRGSMALNCKRFSPSHEGVWGFGCPRFWDDSYNGLMSVWAISFDRDPNDHPCAFPVSLVKPLIGSSVRRDGIVCDPFMGSGTSGVAAVRLGRRFIGAELEPKYFEIAKRRIQDELSRFAFLEPKKQPEPDPVMEFEE